MGKKNKFNKDTLRALFDYNLFSQNEKLEKLAKKSLAEISEPLCLASLEKLSAAGKADGGDLPSSLKPKD